ncbi:hypothetical protein DL96DRAFT_1466816 [Flagelloscypha sp. PMI_526]|nr:hypothetical protein DL96DRAFT_1466816 [Flagelloscypha sp. PMI_526]
MVKKSGLQLEVLSLYRRAIRMALRKPPPSREQFLLFVRYTFRTTASSVTSRDVTAIEHLLRKGRRQIETFESSHVKVCSVSEQSKLIPSLYLRLSNLMSAVP